MEVSAGSNRIRADTVPEFPCFSHLHHLSWIGYLPGQSSSCGNSRITKIDERVRISHPSFKIPGLCSQANFTISQDTKMYTVACSAACTGNQCACLHKCFNG